jgi:hypothetical protein
MPSQSVTYRLRIRNAADSADEMVATSGTGTGAHIVEPPRVDGSSFDPLTGKLSIGSAVVRVADPLLSAGTRFVTQYLADASGNSQLLSRRAFIDIDRGAGFAGYFAGYVSDLELVDAITYSITLAHTTRDDATTKVWNDSQNANLAARSYLFGGPVSAAVPSAHPTTVLQQPQGFWQARVIAVYSTFVHLDILEDASAAFPPGDLQRELRDRGVLRLNNNAFQRNVFRWARGNAERYFRRGFPSEAARTQWTTNPTGKGPIRGYMPRVDVQFLAKNGMMINHRAAMMGGYSVIIPALFGQPEREVEATVFEDLGNHFYVAWANTDPVAQPLPNDVLTFYAVPRDVSPAAPVWVRDHPVDVLAGILTDSGYVVDSGSLAAARAAVGAIQVSLRITEAMTLERATEMLCGAFGLGVRFNTDGTRTIFCWRPRRTPVATITADDLAGTDHGWWETSEASRVSNVRWKFARFDVWPGETARVEGESASVSDRPLDGIIELGDEPIEFAAFAEAPPDSRQQEYVVPGVILASDGSRLSSLVDTTAAWADQILEVYANGAQTTSLAVLHTVTADVGDEVVLNLPPRPGMISSQTPTAQRGTIEQCLVIGRTPQPFGATLRLLRVKAVAPAPDGTGTTPPVLPPLDNSFTLDLGTPPSRRVLLELDDETGWEDVAVLDIEYLVQDDAPDASDVGLRWPERWAPPGVFDAGPFTPGRTVWFRVRTVYLAIFSPGEWTAWQSITLDEASLTPPGVVLTPTVTYVLNEGTGEVDVTVLAGVEAVKVYCRASLATFPPAQDIIDNGAEDVSAPYEFPALVTIPDGQIAYIGAIAEDEDGLRSLVNYAVVRRGVPTDEGLNVRGGLRFVPDNTYDIGEVSNYRPRNVYVAGTVFAQDFVLTDGGTGEPATIGPAIVVWGSAVPDGTPAALNTTATPLSILRFSGPGVTTTADDGDVSVVIEGGGGGGGGITLSSPLTGYTAGSDVALEATDTILQAFGKAQGQINTRIRLTSAITGYEAGINVPLAATDTLLAALGKLQGQVTARLEKNQPILFDPDNTYDIGELTDHRPRNIYAAGSVFAQDFVLIDGGTGEPATIGPAIVVWGSAVPDGTPAALNTTATPLSILRFSGPGVTVTHTAGDISVVVSGGGGSGDLTLASPITGYTVGGNTALAATDTILQAFGKLQGQVDARLSANQTITLSGDATGSGATAITVSIAESVVTGKVLTGYSVGSNTALAATDTILQAFNKVQGQINARLTSNQTITLSGDVSGSGATSIGVTLANSGVTAGTYNDVASQVRPFTVDAKGRVTSIGAAVNIAITAGSVSGLAASATTDATNASNISTGTLPSGRISGAYTGITGVGTLASLTVTGAATFTNGPLTVATSYKIGGLVYSTSNPGSPSGVPDGALWVVYSA